MPPVCLHEGPSRPARDRSSVDRSNAQNALRHPRVAPPACRIVVVACAHCVPARSVAEPPRRLRCATRSKAEYVCPHRRSRYHCTQCGGGYRCVHGLFRYACVQCRVERPCEHGLQTVFCWKCDSGVVCPHGRFTRECLPCAGSAVCVHGTHRRNCPVCRPACVHGRPPFRCVPCGRGVCPRHPTVLKHDCAKCYKRRRRFGQAGVQELPQLMTSWTAL